MGFWLLNPDDTGFGESNGFKATTYLKPGEMKIAQNNDGGFEQTFYLRDATDDTKMVFGGDDNKWTITEAATYDVTVNLADMTIDIKSIMPIS